MKANARSANGRWYKLAALLLPFLFFYGSVFKASASTPETVPVIVVNDARAEFPQLNWKLDNTVSNVEFYHAVGSCNGKAVVYLKFVNRNAVPVKATWKEAFIVNEGQRVEGFGAAKEILLMPGVLAPNECAAPAGKRLIINGGDVDPTRIVVIRDFTFRSIQVVNAQ